MQKKWKYKNEKLNYQAVVNMSDKYHIPRVIATLLLNRGVDGDEVVNYIKKPMSGIINPYKMLGMDKAVKRIVRALENKEKIVIYGDYDVDGITSTSLLYSFLEERGAYVKYYIPDRREEGYGINILAVNRLAKEGTKLLITVDCGITAVGEVEFAKLQGMDVIITDHHTCKEKLPTAAVAVINPKQPDCTYPFDTLAGVGVAFKLMLALAMELGLNTSEYFKKYADLAAIGTIADVVPLLGENRIIAARGLEVLKTTQRPGIRALLEVSGTEQSKLTASSVAFVISPRLNAAGRLGSASTSVDLLLCSDREKAQKIALELDEENKKRRETELKIYNEALEMISRDEKFNEKKVIVLAHEGWHHGVIGIVASKINDLFYKPCILISYEGNEGKGSGRSIPNFNLFDALTHCDSLLTNFGGHAIAAGLNLHMSDFEAFDIEINKYAQSMITPDDMIPSVNIDCKLRETDVNINSVKMINKLEPFGMSNEKPVFSIEGMQIASISAVGLDNKHLRIRFMKNNTYINGIGFSMGNMIKTLHTGDIVNIAFIMDINVYQGIESVQVILKDIQKP